jgi:hypothetical protein
MTATAKTRRTLKVSQRLDREYIPAVVVTEGRKVDAYAVFSFAGAVAWQNRAECLRSYTVACTGGVPTACTCTGFKFKGRCRHVSGTRKLIELGELTPPADEQDRPEGWMHSVQ